MLNVFLTDIRGRHFPRTELERSSFAASREHDGGVPHPRCRLVAWHLAAWLLLQKRQKSYISRDECTKPLPLAVSWQDSNLHGQVTHKIYVHFFCVCMYLSLDHVVINMLAKHIWSIARQVWICWLTTKIKKKILLLIPSSAGWFF